MTCSDLGGKKAYVRLNCAIKNNGVAIIAITLK